MPGTCSSSGRRKCLMRPVVAGLITALTVLAAACDWPRAPTPKPRETATASAPTNAVTPPDTPAGAQPGWLVVAMAHLPVSEADARAHFNASYLATISPTALTSGCKGSTNGSMQQAAPPTWSRSRSVNRAWWSLSSPTAVRAARSGWAHCRQPRPDWRSRHQPGHHRVGAPDVGRCRCRAPLGCP
jgi:hypothetical protein